MDNRELGGSSALMLVPYDPSPETSETRSLLLVGRGWRRQMSQLGHALEPNAFVRVILLTDSSDPELLHAARAGVDEIVSDGFTRETIEALRVAVESRVGRRSVRQKTAANAARPALLHPQFQHLLSCGLTRRQAEVGFLAAKGFRNDEIAAQLCVAQSTVKCHLRTVYQTLKISRRTGLRAFVAGRAAAL